MRFYVCGVTGTGAIRARITVVSYEHGKIPISTAALPNITDQPERISNDCHPHRHAHDKKAICADSSAQSIIEPAADYRELPRGR